MTYDLSKLDSRFYLMGQFPLGINMGIGKGGIRATAICSLSPQTAACLPMPKGCWKGNSNCRYSAAVICDWGPVPAFLISVIPPLIWNRKDLRCVLMSFIKLYLATRRSAVACGMFVAKLDVRSGWKVCPLSISHPKSEAMWIKERLEHSKPLARWGCLFFSHTHTGNLAVLSACLSE